MQETTTQTTLSVLVLGDSEELCERVRATVDGISSVATSTAIDGLHEGAQRLDESDPDVVVVIVDDDADRALTAVDAISRRPSPPPVLALGHDTHPESCIRAMRAGATELLALPLIADELALALAKIAEVRRLSRGDGASRGEIWTVLGPKEGVGATTLVANLGIELRRAGHDVVLVDFDFRNAELALMLNLSPPYSLLDLATVTHLDPIFVQGTLVRHDSGLYLLAAPGHESATVDMRRDRVTALLALLRATHDYIIIDAPTPISEMVSAAVSASDRIMLPTELTVPCLRAAWRTIAALSSVNREPPRLDVVVAKHGPHTVDITLAEARSTLKVPLTVTLPRDDETACGALNRGVSLADVNPASPLRKAIATLADDLAGRRDEEPKRKGLLSLLF